MMDEKNAEKLNALLRTLKSSGLAASTKDAVELATRMLDGALEEDAPRPGQKQERTPEEKIEAKEKAVDKENAGKQTQLTEGEEKERLPTVDEIEAAPELNRESQSYDVTKEAKTLKEIMDEDAERVYKEKKKEENA